MCDIKILINICCVLLILILLILVILLCKSSKNQLCKSSKNQVYFNNKPQSKSLELYLKSKNAPSTILDLPLFNFYINSSHNSYLDSVQIIGNSSANNTLRCLQMGARCIELDISKDTKGITDPVNPLMYIPILKDIPVVSHKKTDASTSVLRDHLEIIKNNAFLNTNDPLFIFLEIYDTQYEEYMENIGKLIKHHLGSRLYEFTLDKVFKSNSNDIDKYLPNVPIKNLLGKICIIINYFGMNVGNGLEYRDKYLAPVVHATTDEPKNGWYDNNSKSIISGQAETSQIKNSFKSLVRVYPSNLFSAISSESNYYIQPYIDNGYSFIAINFVSVQNKYLEYNLEFFKSSNILPKNFYETNVGTLESIKLYRGMNWIQNATFNSVPISILDHNTPLIPQFARSYPRLLANHAYSNNCTWNFNDMTLKMQDDGNLTISKNNQIIKSTNTGGNPGAVLVISRNGDITIYSSQNGDNILWESRTNINDIKIGNCYNYNILSYDTDKIMKDFGRLADCPSEFKHMGLTCYRPEISKSSDFGLGTDELADCPDGYVNTLTSCHRIGTSFQRDYFSQAGRSIDTDKKNCEKRFGKDNCEIRGVPGSRLARAKNCEIEAKYYNYKNPELYVDDNLTTMGARCYIHAHTLGSIKNYGQCPPLNDKNKKYITKTGAFCYVNCEKEYGPGYYNNATSCWRDPETRSSDVMTCDSNEYKFTTPIIYGGVKCFPYCPSSFINVGAIFDGSLKVILPTADGKIQTIL